MKRQLFILAFLGLFSASVWAADCSTTIEGNDMMRYNKSSITIPLSCDNFTLTLKHTGNLPRNVMGHNWVLSLASDEPGIDADGAKAGLKNNYLKPGDKRVIAHTKVVGAGHSDSVTFDTSKLKKGNSYVFFCSFPGHAALMKGTIKLK